MAPTSPTVAQWELNLRLRTRRKELGMDVKTITDRLGFTRNYWSIVENDRRILTDEHLDIIIDMFEFDADEAKELRNLRSAAKDRGWWAGYGPLLTPSVARLIGMEHGATQIQAFESGVVNGLLQTRAYSRAVHAASVFARQSDIDRFVEVRVRRQERLFDADPLRLTVLMTEGVLHQQIGGPEVQREQLQHLITMVEEHPDTIDVRILPFTATGMGLLGTGTYTMMEFPSPHLPVRGWYEMATVNGFIDDQDSLRNLNITYGHACDEAYDRENSLNCIRRAIKVLQ